MWSYDWWNKVRQGEKKGGEGKKSEGETPMSYTNPPLQQKARERLETLTHASQNVIEALAVWCAVKEYRDEVQFGHVSQAMDMFLAAVCSRTPRPRPASPRVPKRRRTHSRYNPRLRRCRRRYRR